MTSENLYKRTKKATSKEMKLTPHHIKVLGFIGDSADGIKRGDIVAEIADGRLITTGQDASRLLAFLQMKFKQYELIQIIKAEPVAKPAKDKAPATNDDAAKPAKAARKKATKKSTKKND